MEFSDGEFRDFSDEEFMYERTRYALHCYTWFSPDNGKTIHSKRYSRIHRDIDGREFVNRFNKRYYLKQGVNNT